MLLNEYYRIDERIALNDESIFGIILLSDYHVYEGHFPGNPVSPGVCTIQMIKECAELLADKRLMLVYLAKCRFSAMLSPQSSSRRWLRLRLTETDEEKNANYQVIATIYDDVKTYVEFKGEFAIR